MMATRAEHLAWCKERALEYIDAGDVQNGVTSFASDVRKDASTADDASSIGMTCISFLLDRPSPEQARQFIEEFT
jgi:hypothetical protein